MIRKRVIPHDRDLTFVAARITDPKSTLSPEQKKSLAGLPHVDDDQVAFVLVRSREAVRDHYSPRNTGINHTREQE